MGVWSEWSKSGPVVITNLIICGAWAYRLISAFDVELAGDSIAPLDLLSLQEIGNADIYPNLAPSAAQKSFRDLFQSCYCWNVRESFVIVSQGILIAAHNWYYSIYMDLKIVSAGWFFTLSKINSKDYIYYNNYYSNLRIFI